MKAYAVQTCTNTKVTLSVPGESGAVQVNVTDDFTALSVWVTASLCDVTVHDSAYIVTVAAKLVYRCYWIYEELKTYIFGLKWRTEPTTSERWRSISDTTFTTPQLRSCKLHSTVKKM